MLLTHESPFEQIILAYYLHSALSVFFITWSNSKMNPVYGATYVQLGSHGSHFQAMVVIFYSFVFDVYVTLFKQWLFDTT